MNLSPTTWPKDDGDNSRLRQRVIDTGSAQRFLSQRQRANAAVMVTKDAGLTAEVEITNGGLLAVAALVSSILLSTAVVVHVARRDARSKKLW